MTFARLLDKPKIIALIADVNEGKSMTLFNILKECCDNYRFNLAYFGLREDVLGGTRIHSVQELESIRDSLVIVDEFASLFRVEDRKEKKSIEKSLRLINHNNNILILAGPPENFPKFIAGKVNVALFKRCTIADFINGSRVKNILLSYHGDELGSEVLSMPIDEVLIFDGKHYRTERVEYLRLYDTKRRNQTILKSVRENVPENVEKT